MISYAGQENAQTSFPPPLHGSLVTHVSVARALSRVLVQSQMSGLFYSRSRKSAPIGIQRRVTGVLLKSPNP